MSCAMGGGSPSRTSATRDIVLELKQLRLHGMVAAWAELVEQGHTELEAARWLLEHLMQAEMTDRGMRSVSHQMHAAKFPVHRDLAGFDFAVSPVDRKLIHQLAEMSFTESAINAVMVGGPGTGTSHLATAIGVAGITRHGKRVRFYSTVDFLWRRRRAHQSAVGRKEQLGKIMVALDVAAGQRVDSIHPRIEGVGVHR